MRFAKIIATLLCTAAGTGAAFAQGAPLPWGESSDELAWQVFTQIVAPTGVPGSKAVMFETWASDPDIYVPAGQQPHWPGINEPKRLQPSQLAIARNASKPGPHIITPNQCQPPNDPQSGNFPSGQCIGEEVRRNWSSYQYIVSNKLWSTAGLKQAFADKLDVDFPADAIEAKGDWAKVDVVRDWINDTIKPNPPLTTDDVRKRYHVNVASDGQEYALLGLAISSKQVKDWLWATWEHELSPGRCDDIGCRDKFGAADADVKPKNVNGGAPNQYYGKCERSKAGKALLDAAGLGAVWENYCLKGSQITFTDKSEPTVLGNSVVERINAGVPIPQSSCITCHSYAGFANDGTPNGVFGGIGDTNKAHLQGIRQNDFLWGLLGAN
jgi:hypothetical protein